MTERLTPSYDVNYSCQICPHTKDEHTFDGCHVDDCPCEATPQDIRVFAEHALVLEGRDPGRCQQCTHLKGSHFSQVNPRSASGHGCAVCDILGGCCKNLGAR